MGDLSGRTYLVTGGNTGIGRETVAGLARRGGKVYLAARSPEKGEAAVADIVAAHPGSDVTFLQLDLADLASVRQFAAAFLARDEPLHVLVNNAGLAGQRGVTADGFELAFGVNHLGHFALTTALSGLLVASAPSRIVNVASDAHYQARGIDYDVLRRRTASRAGMREYAVSKLCNVVFAQELARRLGDRGVTACSLHPGVVASDIWRRVPWPVRPIIKSRMISTEQGALTSLHCATADSVANGAYYGKCTEKPASKVATPELARLLWERSEAWTAP